MINSNGPVRAIRPSAIRVLIAVIELGSTGAMSAVSLAFAIDRCLSAQSVPRVELNAL
jgi:hypothetical protein